MKRHITTLLAVILPLIAGAQTPSFGYYSSQEVLRQVPAYAETQRNMEALKQQYAAETQRAAEEFSAKYEEFLDQQHTLAPSIKRKRTAELQELVAKTTGFKEEADRLLAQAEQEAYKPFLDKLAETVSRIGNEQQLAFIIDTDKTPLDFVSPTAGKDLTNELIHLIK